MTKDVKKEEVKVAQTFDMEFAEKAKKAIENVLSTDKTNKFTNRVDGAIVIPIYSKGIDENKLASGVLVMNEEGKKDIDHIVSTIDRSSSFAVKFATQYILRLLESNQELTNYVQKLTTGAPETLETPESANNCKEGCSCDAHKEDSK